MRRLFDVMFEICIAGLNCRAGYSTVFENDEDVAGASSVARGASYLSPSVLLFNFVAFFGQIFRKQAASKKNFFCEIY